MGRQTNLAANEYLHAPTKEPESTAAPVANRDPEVEENSGERTKTVHIVGQRICPMAFYKDIPSPNIFCEMCGHCVQNPPLIDG